ncbi:membrane-associated protein, putative [Bodo saltans]|uniref:Elongation of fatty acids protein n=1 Tax=Bodo saltans TaxID=75058 RepID=A0A0S4IVJ6_BODSA|nr:membrane-associated protein, putative [Bodo saltans]|eukprot:CUG00463.1 membrane-associated protein, putative [Bodo saltans]
MSWTSVVDVLTSRLNDFTYSVWVPPVEEFLAPQNFDCHAMHRWVRSNQYATPVAAVIAYLLAIFVVLPLVRWRQRSAVPAAMKHLFALWNLLLSLFSGYGVYVCAPFVWRMISEKGMRYAVCSDDMMLGGTAGDEHAACYGTVGFMMTLFMLSKLPELLDTVFLVVMHKDVLFLHWYHHVTVLMYSWFAYHNATPSAVVFGTMNYCVHSVMYFYFFASQYTKAFGFLRKPITSIQLMQMVLGVSITAFAYVYENDAGNAETPCSRTYKDSGFYLFCFVLYGSYLLLFAKLYYDSYIKKSRGGGKKEISTSANTIKKRK